MQSIAVGDSLIHYMIFIMSFNSFNMEKITSLKDHFNKMDKNLLLMISEMYGVKITKTLKKTRNC